MMAQSRSTGNDAGVLTREQAKASPTACCRLAAPMRRA